MSRRTSCGRVSGGPTLAEEALKKPAPMKQWTLGEMKLARVMRIKERAELLKIKLELLLGEIDQSGVGFRPNNFDIAGSDVDTINRNLGELQLLQDLPDRLKGDLK